MMSIALLIAPEKCWKRKEILYLIQIHRVDNNIFQFKNDIYSILLQEKFIGQSNWWARRAEKESKPIKINELLKLMK